MAIDGAKEAARAGAGRVSESAGFTIRAATAADEPAMVDLEHESAIHHASVDPERWRVPPREAVATYRARRREADPDGAALLAIAPDGRVIGMVEMLLRGYLSDPGQARIPTPSVDIGLSVTEVWRGRGVGTALMAAAEGWALDHGAARMVLDLAAANAGAQRLYERLGYETSGLMMDRRLGGGVVASAARGGEPAAIASSAAENDAHWRITTGGGGSGDGASEGRAEADGAADELPTLEGEAVRLRPLLESDREALLEVLRDPSVVEIWDTRGSENSANELLAGEPGWFVWAIEVGGEFAGSIQATEEQDGDYHMAGIDIFMSSRFQGRGLGTDAIRTLARWLIDVRGHHRLTIDPAADNARAIHTYEKVGFKPVGVLRQYERGVDGTFHDGLLMDMLADELR